MTETVFISTNALRFDQISEPIAGIPDLDVRVSRGAIGSESLMLAFTYTKDAFARVLAAIKEHLRKQDSILIEMETVEKGRKVKKKLEVTGHQLEGPIDPVQLWNQLK